MNLEPLEDRCVPSLGPVTLWHFAPADNFHAGAYTAPGDPGSAGFNLVFVTSPQQLALVPPGCKALVSVHDVLGNSPDFATFAAYTKPFLGDPRVYGFYLADEPNPAAVPASTLKAESDWIHANDPGAKTFFVMGAGPLFSPVYTPANTDMDYVGLDPYPIRSWGVHFEYIPLAVLSAEMIGWSNVQLVPVYQSFGNFGSFSNPTPLEEQIDIALWGLLTPTPAFDYAYSWGEWGATSLIDRPDMQGVLAEHNAHAWNPLSLFAALESQVPHTP